MHEKADSFVKEDGDGPLWLLASLLGGASLLGAVTSHILIPGLPAIGADLRASSQQVQFTIVTYLAATAVGQLVYGPASDKLGRRWPLLFGMTFYLAACVGCALSTSIQELMVFRTMQGLGACSGFVITRAIIRDLHTGWKAARLLSTAMLVSSLGPLAAPILGSAILAVAPWPYLFWSLCGLAIVVLIITVRWLPESLPVADRATLSLTRLVAGYGVLFRHRHFMCLVVAAAASQACAFSYLAASSFIFSDIFGLNAFHYAIVQSCTSLAWIAGVQAAPFVMRRLGASSTIKAGLVTAVTAGLLLMVIQDHAGMLAMLVFILIDFVGVGLILSPALTKAMHDFGTNAGSAAAIAGALQFSFAALASAASAFVYRGTIAPVAAVMLGCVAISFFFARMGLRQPQETSP